MGNDLSVEAKQTFQVVALLATSLVVGIHYQSDVPNSPSPAEASWNELAQEFVFGGIARVAVPLFAFAAGFFYFRTDDGSLATYRKKVTQRVRTVVVPFFIIASIATASWLIIRRINGHPADLTPAQLLTTWLLRPPAEQLWFLRDLMVLVLAAPLIAWLGQHSMRRRILAGVLAIAWAINWQVFPVVAGWRLLHMETLLFFFLGYLMVSHTDWIEKVGSAPVSVVLAGWSLWCGLIVGRICLRADFDIWYSSDYRLPDLLLHQTSILVGMPTLFMTAWRSRCDLLVRISGGSFFVYLVHEFPLRAIVERFSDSWIDHRYSCWLLTPIVLFGCYGAVVLLGHWFPVAVAIVTGGRLPSSTTQQATVFSRIFSTPKQSS